MVDVRGRKVKFEVSSGAAANVLTRKSVIPCQIMLSTTTLRMWNGAKVTPISKVNLSVTSPHTAEFIVVQDDLTPLIELSCS